MSACARKPQRQPGAEKRRAATRVRELQKEPNPEAGARSARQRKRGCHNHGCARGSSRPRSGRPRTHESHRGRQARDRSERNPISRQRQARSAPVKRESHHNRVPEDPAPARCERERDARATIVRRGGTTRQARGERPRMYESHGCQARKARRHAVRALKGTRSRGGCEARASDRVHATTTAVHEDTAPGAASAYAMRWQPPFD